MRRKVYVVGWCKAKGWKWTNWLVVWVRWRWASQGWRGANGGGNREGVATLEDDGVFKTENQLMVLVVVSLVDKNIYGWFLARSETVFTWVVRGGAMVIIDNDLKGRRRTSTVWRNTIQLLGFCQRQEVVAWWSLGRLVSGFLNFFFN